MTYLLAHPFLFFSAGFGVVMLALAWFVVALYRRWHRVFGARANTPTEAVQEIAQRLTRAEGRLGAMEPRVDVLERIGRIAVQKVGFMRFNPFEHTGSDQSFAIALLDRADNGLVLSSLYTREGVRVYAKEILGGNAKHPLSEEEQKVLAQAMKREVRSMKQGA